MAFTSLLGRGREEAGMTRINEEYLHDFIKRQEYKLQSKILNSHIDQLQEKMDRKKRFDYLV